MAGGETGARVSWAWAAKVTAFDGRDVIGIGVGGRRLALYRLPDGVFASLDRCPHHGASISHGCIVEGYIECPVHYSLFDIRTGAPDGAVTTNRLTTVPAKIEGDDIYVDLSGLEEIAP